MAAVQLIGRESIVSAFEQVDARGWALLEGKRPIVTGSGAEDLKEWLDRFEAAGSTAIYTLRLYDQDITFDNAVVASCIASFNVKLVDQYAGHGIAGYSTKLEQRIAALEKGDDGDDDGEDIGDIIMGYFKDPNKLETVIGAVMQIFNNGGTGQGIAGVVPPAVSEVGNGDQLQRIASVIDRLQKRDPELLRHLEKLDKLADTNPGLFTMVLKQLDTL